MKRGNLVIYDPLTGDVWHQSGIAEGDLLPHVYPVGIPYIEVPFDEMVNHTVVRIEINAESPYPILEKVETPFSIQQINELKIKIGQSEANNLMTMEAVAEVFEMLLELQGGQ